MQLLEVHLGTKPFKGKLVSGVRAVTPDAFQSRGLGLATLQFDLKHFYTPDQFCCCIFFFFQTSGTNVVVDGWLFLLLF